jgi:hypothetical protein
MGNWFTPNVEAYVSKLYGNFDRVLAPSQVMADKLRRLGVRDVTCSRWALTLPPSIPPGATRMCAPNWALPTPAAC